MWFKTARQSPDWSEAQSHLLRVEPKFTRLIDGVGACTLTPRRDYFASLCQAIFSQQVSTPVAAVLFARFRKLFPRRRPTPKLVLAADDGSLRSVGLSRQKLSYLRDLARHFATGAIPTRRFATMDDQQIIDALTAVNGIGRWTAEMFLIFVLNRPDVLPVDDLGVRKAMLSLLGLPDATKPRELFAPAEPWRPWRTVATWYLWRGATAGLLSDQPE